MKKLVGMALLALLAVGCGGSKEETRPAPRSAPLTLEEARAAVQALEQEQARLNANDPLRQPKSLDDVLAVLKRDEVDLFPGAVAFAEKEGSPQALQLAAQIELAWGDSHLILAHLYSDAATRLRDSIRTIKSRGLFVVATPQEQQHVAELEKTARQCDTMAEALTVLAYEHLGRGGRRAQQLMAQAPTDYHGYRVAADYYRLTQNWARFDEMIQKIEETNPTSNGLVFQRGAAALQRNNRADEAAQFLRDALTKDPQFTRAQVFVLMTRNDPVESYQELEKLRAMSPNHQVVVWAGPAITAAYKARLAALNASGSPTPPQGLNDPLNRGQRTP